MRIFKVNKHIEVVCDAKRTRNGFKHTATLMLDGLEMETATCHYQNRTWESYEFQSVLLKLAEMTKSISDRQKKMLTRYANDTGNDHSGDNLKTIANVMSLGDIFCDTRKDKNDWKTRMIQAGLGGKGLIMPEDWDTLSEEEKETRLNGAMGALRENA